MQENALENLKKGALEKNTLVFYGKILQKKNISKTSQMLFLANYTLQLLLTR